MDVSKGLMVNQKKAEADLIYLSNSVFPSKFANAVHVMKMCNAFALLNINVILLGKRFDNKVDLKQLFSDYSVTESSFKIVLFKLFRIPFSSLLVSVIGYLLYILLNKKPNTVIYSRNRHASFMLALMGVRQVYEMHGISSYKIQDWIDKKICLAANMKVVVISNVLKQDLLLRYKGLDPRKIIVAHDGADLINVAKVPRQELRGGFGYNIGYIGSLLPGKGVELLCRAALKLPSYGFHIVGGSAQEIDKLMLAYSEAENLFFYGFVPHGSTGSYLKSFDAVALPNEQVVKTANGEDIGRYTSPLKLFEYLSFDKKIIFSDIPVLKEVLEDGYGYSFYPGAIDSLVDIISQTEYYSPVKSGRELVEAKYTWKSRAESILKSVS